MSSKARKVWKTPKKELHPDAPACQVSEDRRPDNKKGKKCQAALLDNTEKMILIVYENAYPVYMRRWGLPKGKFKLEESNTDCVHREVCEEVGIEVDQYPHIYRKKGRDHIIVFNKPAEEINLYLGPEILDAKWVDLDWLKKDIRQDSEEADKHPKGKYQYKYNRDIRELVPKIK